MAASLHKWIKASGSESLRGGKPAPPPPGTRSAGSLFDESKRASRIADIATTVARQRGTAEENKKAATSHRIAAVAARAAGDHVAAERHDARERAHDSIASEKDSTGVSGLVDAQILSDKAEAASKIANNPKSGDSTSERVRQHQNAQEAHSEAAWKNRNVGLDAKADKHEAKAKEHGVAAERARDEQGRFTSK